MRASVWSGKQRPTLFSDTPTLPSFCLVEESYSSPIRSGAINASWEMLTFPPALSYAQLRFRRGRPPSALPHPQNEGHSSPIRSAAMNASWGIETLPYSLILALPFFCLSSSFFLRLMSPP